MQYVAEQRFRIKKSDSLKYGLKNLLGNLREKL